MREVVGALTGVIITLYLLYFAIPMLSITHDSAILFFNQTDPTISTTLALGSGWYSALPLVGILVMAFLLFSYALRREPYE